MDFKTYLESRDYKNPSGQSGKLIREIEIGRVMKEKPENLDELIEERLDDPKNRLKLQDELKLRTEFWIDGDNNENLRQTEFRIFKTRHYSKPEKTKKGVLVQDQLGNASLLIYPFFSSLEFNPTFNIFICKAKSPSEPFPSEFYFFDVHGRLLDISTDYSWHTDLPPVAYDKEKREVFQIKPIPKGFRFSGALDLYRYWVKDQHDFTAIINHKGEWVVEPNYYSNITFRKGMNIAFVRRLGETFKLNFKTSELEKLPFRVYDFNETHLRIVSGDFDNLKWGLMEFNASVIHAPKYDYINFSHCGNRNIVFSGKYAIGDFLDIREAWLKDYDEARELTLGLCGVIDQDGNVIIPIEFDYIKEVAMGHFMVNSGCTVYKCGNDYDDGGNDPATAYCRVIKGGTWTLYDDNGIQKRPLSFEEVRKIQSEFRYSKDKYIIVVE